jgi:hypothetical protein
LKTVADTAKEREREREKERERERKIDDCMLIVIFIHKDIPFHKYILEQNDIKLISFNLF